MEFPVTINDQAGFDELVKSRLERERAKFADYNDLKNQVAALTRERDEAAAKADKAEADYTTLKTSQEEAERLAEQERELEQLRKKVAEATGVPAIALKGTTEEELTAHAEELKPFISHAPHVPDPGKTPDRNPQEDEMREFTRSLFGHSE